MNVLGIEQRKSCDISTPICIYSITEHIEKFHPLQCTLEKMDLSLIFGPLQCTQEKMDLSLIFGLWFCTHAYKLHFNVICYQEFENYRSVFCVQMMFFLVFCFFCVFFLGGEGFAGVHACIICHYFPVIFIYLSHFSTLMYLTLCIFLQENNFQLAIHNPLIKVPTKSWAFSWLVPQASHGTNHRRSLFA